MVTAYINTLWLLYCERADYRRVVKGLVITKVTRSISTSLIIGIYTGSVNGEAKCAEGFGNSHHGVFFRVKRENANWDIQIHNKA